MANRKGGRKAGTKNKGYFFRTGRGWYVSRGKQMLPLVDEQGEHLKDEKTKAADLRKAYACFLTTEPVIPKSVASTTVLSICTKYLQHLKAKGDEGTHEIRSRALFDFCYGLPQQYRQSANESFHSEKMSTTPVSLDDIKSQKKRTTYANRLAEELTKADLDQWLHTHKEKKSSGKRILAVSIKRVMSFAVERGLIKVNQIKDYKLPSNGSGRVTYITPEQEEAIIDASHNRFATAVRVCIRTGMRPGIEFAKVTAKHVHSQDDRLEIVFQPEETKGKKHRRVIFVTDSETVKTIRRLCDLYPDGPIFRSPYQCKPWNRETLSRCFRTTKAKLKKQGIVLDSDCCMYSCRHTYAKRVLQGYWNGQHTNIETLARLMGNSPYVCRKYYLQWSEIDNEQLWKFS